MPLKTVTDTFPAKKLLNTANEGYVLLPNTYNGGLRTGKLVDLGTKVTFYVPRSDIVQNSYWIFGVKGDFVVLLGLGTETRKGFWRQISKF